MRDLCMESYLPSDDLEVPQVVRRGKCTTFLAVPRMYIFHNAPFTWRVLGKCFVTIPLGDFSFKHDAKVTKTSIFDNAKEGPSSFQAWHNRMVS